MRQSNNLQPTALLLVPIGIGGFVVLSARVLPELMIETAAPSQGVAGVLVALLDTALWISLLVNELPFLVIGGVLLWMGRQRDKGAEPHQAIWTGVWAGLFLLAATIFVVHFAVWSDVARGGEGSSTAVIALFLGPLYGSISLIVGVALGAVASALVSGR